MQIPSPSNRFETGNSDLDLRHRFVGTVTYELPFGKNFTGAKKLALAGWQANTVLDLELRQSVHHNRQLHRLCLIPSLTESAADQRVQTRSLTATLSNPSIGEWFNPAAFVIPPLGTIGNTARNSLYGPSFRHFDLSIFKDFTLTERR